MTAFCGSFKNKQEDSVLDKLHLKEEIQKNIVQNLATETSNRNQMSSYLDQLTNAVTSTKSNNKSPGKLLKDELFHPILSSKKSNSNSNNLDSYQVSIENAPVRVMSPVDPQSRQDDSIFTTSSNNRYIKTK